jgi:phytoene synthase
MRLDAIYAGRPEGALDRAVRAVVVRHGIPREELDRLVEGFGWDEEGRRYDDLEGVIAYAMRVAGSVGEMMARIMGVRGAAALQAAAALGCAMQLTNIARDVGDDARLGRLYLPLDWMREAGLDPQEWLARPVFSAALGGVVRRLLAEADRLYAQAQGGIALLPGRCRPAIRAASSLYGAIGAEVARRDYDSVSSRAVVPLWRKGSLLCGALAESPLSVWSRIDDRIGWTLELFARLEAEARERGIRNGSMS